MNREDGLVWWSEKVRGNDVDAATCVCVCVCVAELLSLLVPRVHLFSQVGLSPSPTLSASLLFLFCAFLSPLSSPVPSHQGLSSTGLICRSSSANLIGDRLSLAWHGDELPNPFSPSCLGLAPLDVQRCALMQLQQLQRQARHSKTHPAPTVLMLLHLATTAKASLAKPVPVNSKLQTGTKINTV